MTSNDSFHYFSEKFADLQILRYRVPGFESLPRARKELIYYLYEAALSGRDIIWDQNYRHNLRIRQTLEAIITGYPGDRKTPAFDAFTVYVKRVWFSNGIHHHYSSAKHAPDFTFEEFARWARACDPDAFPLATDESLAQFLDWLRPILFDPDQDAKKVNKQRGVDRVRASAVNYYQGLREAEVEAFYRDRIDPTDATPVSHGLNATLVKENGAIYEKVWKADGLYGTAIQKMIEWLEKAVPLAENSKQREALTRLIAFYRTGDLKDFDAYCIAWVDDRDGQVDLIHGFIETYNDPLGYRGAYEAMVSIKDPIATKRVDLITANAQWFEDHSPIMDAYKRKRVKGMSGAVINVVVEAGDSSPSTPIGVNLPNSDWIRENHGSKSVNLANIVTAYNQASGLLKQAFSFSKEEIERDARYGELADNLHTDLHEVIGHGSGKLGAGVAPPRKTLRHYASTLEEARADLVALYFMLTPKLAELGLAPCRDVGKTLYDDFIRNGLMVQLRRLKPGELLEEDHMRNRQLIAKWALERGEPENVIEKVVRQGKTYFVINDYDKLQKIFGRLLREVQRIKSEGDFEAGEALVENYGVAVDKEIHQEVLDRVAELDLAAYSGFINPRLVPIYQQGAIVDVRIEYPDSFTDQMLEYGRNHGFLTFGSGKS